MRSPGESEEAAKDGANGGPAFTAEMPLTRLLSAAARVRPEERRDVLGALVTLFGFMVGHALLETARDALFLSRLHASQLPWAYLGIAVIALPLTLSRPAFLRRLSSRHELSAWLVFSAAVTFGFWLAIRWGGSLVLYALYTWSGVLATIVVVRFWTVLANLFTVTQAKRLFAVIGLGSVLGAIVGSGLARILAEPLAARHLVAAAAAVFLVASLGPRMLADVESPSAGSGLRVTADLARVGHVIWNRPYLRNVAALILVSTVTLTLVDFSFKLTVDRFVAPEAMDEFFASVYLSLSLLSLAVQVLVVGWLVRRWGVAAAVVVLPALLVLGAAGFAVAATLAAALLLKGIDGSFRHSLNRTGTELLFVPLAVESRARIKAVIDVLGQRGGQALASLGILVVVAITANAAVFGVLALVAAVAWLTMAWRLQGRYLDVFRETLAEEITATKIAFPALDVASFEVLLTTLNDVDDRKVIAALDILVGQGKVKVIPALILYHPSSAVVTHALELFSAEGRDDCLPIVERLRQHGNAGVRAAALLVESVMRPDRELLRVAAEDDSPEVRATAVAALVARGWLSSASADGRLRDVVEGRSAEARFALARAIRHLPDAAFVWALVQLARTRERAVRVEAVQAMREVASSEFVPVLVDLLQDRALRDEVTVTLLALGPGMLPRLADGLGDTSLPHAVRRHLPGAIAAFGTQLAAGLLVEQLPKERDGMIRFKILEAVGRLRTDHPHITLDPGVLARAIPQTLGTASGFMRWRQALELGGVSDPSRQTVVQELLVALLRDKQRHTVERLFRLLSLQTGSEDFLRIHRGLHSERREARAGSWELLENIVPTQIRRPLMQLLDDALEPESRQVDGEALPPYETVLAELLESPTESLSAVAAHHIAELGAVTLLPAVRRLQPLSGDHQRVLTNVAASLESQARSEESNA